MRTAVITHRNGELKACELNDVWTVRLAHLETRASYLDLALAELLGNAPEAHRLAARLLTELADLVEQQDAVRPPVARAPRRARRRASRRETWTELPALGLRALVFAVAVGTAFMLTTWLSTLR